MLEMRHDISIAIRGALVLLFVAAAGCGQSPDIVARIGDRSISVPEFESLANELRQSGYQHLQEMDEEAKLELLHGIIARELLRLEGTRRHIDDNPVIAASIRMTEQRALIARLYEEEAVQPEYRFTEDELRSYFVEAQYDTEVLSRHILCSTEEEGREAMASLFAGADFDSLVAVYSSTSVQNRFGSSGWVGWFKVGDLLEELRVPLATMPLGELYPQPVRTSLGWHVFALKERRAVDYEASRDWLRGKLRTKRRAEDMERYVVELRQRYHLVAHEEGLAALRAIPASSTEYLGPQKVLFSWSGDRITVEDYMVAVRAGGSRHPASMDSARVYKAADNLAGRQIMMAEARRLGVDQHAEVRGKVESRRDELLVKWLFQVEAKLKPGDGPGDAEVRGFYEQNLDLFTGKDGKVTDFSLLRDSIRALMVDEAETRAMDRFLDELRDAYDDRIEVFPEALRKCFAAARD